MTQNSMIITVCILCLWIGSTQAHTSSENDYRVNEILQIESANSEPRDSEKAKSCGQNKECVARHLCDKKGMVIRNGEFGVETRDNTIDIRVQGECHFLEVCCNVGYKMNEPQPIPSGPEVCGYRKPNGVGFTITGEKEGESQLDEFPWMVAIFWDGFSDIVYQSGGTVIAPNVVLTTAHNVIYADPKNLIARAGEWDTRTENEILSHQDARVKEIICHEKFRYYLPYNDVALLILETPFNWTANVRPICLPEPNANFNYSRCYATRWGLNKHNKDYQYQVILKKREVPTVSHGTCQAQLRRTRLSKFLHLDSSFMCAAGERDNDMCISDGGSHLVCTDPRNPERYFQAGIVAWGIGCGEANITGVYASVPYFRNWIIEKLSARGIDFSHFTM